MTQTMRERLIVLVGSATGWGVGPGSVTMTRAMAEAIVDAILAELREPDAVMREVGLRAIPDCDVRSPIHHRQHAAFVAMIDAVRGK